MKIICLGDSLTAGVDSSAPHHWLNILQREAAHSYINKGICGDTTGGMLARFHRDVVEEGARSVILMGGGNDLIMGCAPGTVQANIMSLVHQSFFYNIIPVLGIPIAFDTPHVREDWASFADFEEVERKGRVYRDWLRRFADSFHVAALDFHRAFLAYGSDRQSELYADGLHPNEIGNRIMADLILAAGM